MSYEVKPTCPTCNTSVVVDGDMVRRDTEVVAALRQQTAEVVKRMDAVIEKLFSASAKANRRS